LIPAAFDYRRVDSLEEALAALSQAGEDAKLLAGGHSLLPLMKLRLATPNLLIDIGRIEELSYVKDGGESVLVGALTRHRDLEISDLLRRELPLVAHVAGQIGDPQVRHRGTIGGSLAHGDPASDLPAVCLALGAKFRVVGPTGEREVQAKDFFTGFLETALAPDEMLTEVVLPKMDGARWSFQKFNRRAQDWAIVGVTAVRGEDRTGVALINMGSTPLEAVAVEEALAEGASPVEAAARAADGLEPPSDLNASAEFRRHLAQVLVRRALEEVSDAA